MTTNSVREQNYSYKEADCTQMFHIICNKYKDCGAAIRARSYEANDVAYVQPIARDYRPNHSPMTLKEFEKNFQIRYAYKRAARNQAAYASTVGRVPNNSVARLSNPAARQPQSSLRSHRSTSVQNPRGSAQPTPRNHIVSRYPNTVPTTQQSRSASTRRAVNNNLRGEDRLFKDLSVSFIQSFEKIPFAILAIIVVCVVSLILVVTSSAAIGDAQREYSALQQDVSALAATENDLHIQVQEKNDLRLVERIAVNELGMVTKNLVAKEHVEIGTDAVIENYDSETDSLNFGVLLSAIARIRD